MTARLCTVEDCGRPLRCKGLCGLHYERVRTNGTLHVQPRAAHCTADSCAGRVVGYGLCERHYRAVKRLSGQPCSIENCERPRRARGWCEMHLSRWKYHGSAEWEPSVTYTYTGWHNRLTKIKGAANLQACTDCGAQADEWSYDHADPDERRDADRVTHAYSLDPERYLPRCRPCHRSFDLERLRDQLGLSAPDGMMSA